VYMLKCFLSFNDYENFEKVLNKIIFTNIHVTLKLFFNKQTTVAFSKKCVHICHCLFFQLLQLMLMTRTIQ